MTYLRSNGARLYVRDVGSGLPIVVLHGGPDFDSDYFLPELDRLADLGRLVYYDQRGRGRSYSGQGPDDVTIGSEVADLDRVRDWTGSDSIALLGHSWGTTLALEYAVRHPERVSHLILMDPAPVSHGGMLAMRREMVSRRTPEQVERMKVLAADPAFLAGDLAAEIEYNRIHFSSTVRRPEALESLVERLRRNFTPESTVAARAIERRLYELTWSAETYDLDPQLRRLRIPTLVLLGDDDFIPVEIAQGITDAIPDARLVVISDCGHFAFLEQPELVHAAIASFLTASSANSRN